MRNAQCLRFNLSAGLKPDVTRSRAWLQPRHACVKKPESSSGTVPELPGGAGG